MSQPVGSARYNSCICERLLQDGGYPVRAEVLEETIRAEIAQQAERFGVNYSELEPNVQKWLRNLVMEQLYRKDAPQEITPETSEEE
jgi:hypothetical protein